VLSGERIAILGASGMLGSSLVELCESSKVAHIRGAYSNSDSRSFAIVDIQNPESLTFFLNSWEPSIVINCAAYTNVDKAEEDYESAFSINASGVKNLALACKERGIYLIHVSTDYVFGGKNHTQRVNIPFSENEECSPVGMYGLSKYLGEEFIRACYPENSLIVRTSWLHGRGGKNFVDTIATLVKERSELKVVNDQRGCLTWTPWLSTVLLGLADKKLCGFIHASGSDECTWFDVAEYIANRIKPSCTILPQSTADSGRPAPRPAYSKLNISALSAILGAPPAWKDFVDSHLGLSSLS